MLLNKSMLNKKTLLTYSMALPFYAMAPMALAEGKLETVVVTGHKNLLKLEIEQALTPGGVTVIDSQSLSERNVSSVADMLRYVPGVWSNSTNGSDGVFISTRGSNLDATNYDMNGIKMLQDGLPVTAADGNNHNRIIDPLASRFVTIARGANALKYGASTLGGAIDFASPTAHNTSPLGLFLNVGSNGQQTSRLTASKVFNDSLDALVTIEAKQYDGYRDHSESDRTGAYANFGWRINENVETRLFLTSLKATAELPGALTEAEFEDDLSAANPSAVTGHYQLNVDTLRLANKTTITINENSSLELGFAVEKQTLHHPIVDKIMADFDGPGPMPPQEVFSLLINTEQKDQSVMARYNIEHNNHNMVLGFNWGVNNVTGGNYRNNYGSRNGLTTIVDNGAHGFEAYFIDRWQVSNRWNLIYGLQAVNTERDIKTTDVATGTIRAPSGDYDSINPRIGAIFQATEDISLFANISRIYEAPTNFELEDDVRANQNALDAMHGTVLEIGSRGKYALSEESYWNWDISLYYSKIKDEILSQDDPLAPGTSLTTNVEKTTHAGIEALVGAKFAIASGSIESTLSVTFNHFKFNDDATYGNNTLPAAPKVIVRGDVIYRHSNGFYAGPTFDWVDERYADFMNTYTVDSYFLLGFRTGYKAEKWNVFVDARNLLDDDYVSTFTVLNQAAANSRILNPGEPRSVSVGLQYNF